MAGVRGISLLCFFEVEVILEVKNGLYMGDNLYLLESAMVKEEIPVILTFWTIVFQPFQNNDVVN